MSFFLDLIALIYPDVCAGCSKALRKQENCLCTLCKYHLPRTKQWLHAVNPLAKVFYGRAHIHAAAAFYLFEKGGKVQNLIHLLKYEGRSDVGVEMGRLFGVELSQAPLFAGITMIIPVPLHPKRQRSRGYNQAEVFAQGISAGYTRRGKGSMVWDNVLYRVKNTSTQTKKGRMDRWLNMETTFAINDNWLDGPLEGTHACIFFFHAQSRT